jgi:uncharacterized RDD family membrane protein YckC
MAEAEALARCGVCGAMVASNLVVQLGGKTVCVTCKSAYAREMAGARPVGAFKYAGFWIRFVALFLDGLILMIPMFALMFLFVGGLMVTREHGYGDPAGFQALFYVFFYGLQMLYSTFFHGKFGATPGKMAVKIRVVRSDGSPIGFGRAFGRFFATVLSGLLCNIGYIIAAFDPEKRALHDRICDTRVVYK